jgi:hypothetical protein
MISSKTVTSEDRIDQISKDASPMLNHLKKIKEKFKIERSFKNKQK